MVEVEPERFEAMVGEALDTLPPELGRLMRNVAVTVEHDGPAGLLGLYRGVPLTRRTTHYSAVLPGRITIYRRAICAVRRTDVEVVEQPVGSSSTRSATTSASTTRGYTNSVGELARRNGQPCGYTWQGATCTVVGARLRAARRPGGVVPRCADTAAAGCVHRVPLR